MYLLIILYWIETYIATTRGNNDLRVTVVNKNYGKKSLKHKAAVLWNGLPNILKKVSSIKNFFKKLNIFCSQQTPIVRISSLITNVTNYYSVTDNIFQLIVDFRHMLLVNDDDDVGFSLAFFVRLCYVLHLKKNIFLIIFLCVWLCAW